MTKPSERPLHVLILAGSREKDDPVAAAAHRSCKALVPAHGVPMVERVVASVSEVAGIARIMIAMADGLLLTREAPLLAEWLAEGKIQRIDPASSPARSVEAALAALPPETDLLVTTADHPLLTPAMITIFLHQSRAHNATITAAVTPLEAVLAAYPSTKRTRLRFRDGGYSGCNLFYFSAGRGARLLQFWRRMEEHRKTPWRMALEIGVFTVLRYGLGSLRFDELVNRIGTKVGIKLAAIRLADPEAAIDVDKPEDLALVEEILRRREGPGAAAAPDVEATPAQGKAQESQQQ